MEDYALRKRAGVGLPAWITTCCLLPFPAVSHLTCVLLLRHLPAVSACRSARIPAFWVGGLGGVVPPGLPALVSFLPAVQVLPVLHYRLLILPDSATVLEQVCLPACRSCVHLPPGGGWRNFWR